MTEAETILKMIEAVKPDDTDTLDEIDARVWWWLQNLTNFVALEKRNGISTWWVRHRCPNTQNEYSVKMHDYYLYTRSRDALKAIRPEFVELDIEIGPNIPFRCEIWFDDRTNVEGYGKTEELTELHAIIQAIDYERKNDGLDKESE